MLTEHEFQALARAGHNRIPLALELPADLDTPLSVYLKLANEPFSCLLESVVGGERFGRYSVIGLPAKVRLRVHGHVVTIEEDTEIVETIEADDPLARVAEFAGRYRAAPLPGLPRFAGGLTGYFGYDTVRYIENKLAGVRKPDPLGTPDILLMLTDELAVVDNLYDKLILIVYADPMEPGAYARAAARLHELALRLESPLQPPSPPAVEPAEPASEFGQEGFENAVARSKRYIVDGDIMQVVLSQRLSCPFKASPLSLYRAARGLNPSPYMFYFDMGGFYVTGASPEILVRLEGDTMTLRPIAGTRPRGATREEDEALEKELLADPKELAEHLMLVDLGRNDLGRVAQTGTVKLTERMVIERYSHVMHIVSNVEAKLKPGLTALDVLRATFPAGTVSGAPKVRAMEIIDELEPTKRGVYAGAVGYLGFNGDMDLAIAIRTAVVKDDTLYIQAGAGIVADSVPENEWKETCSKAKGMLRAAELAQLGNPRRSA